MTEYIAKCGEFVGISGKTIQFPEYIDMSQEIVRCRDCANLNIVGKCPCGFWALEDMKLDGFCKWGERE